MVIVPRLLISICFAPLFVSAANALPPLERSLSSSRQFVVYGPDARLRGVVCDLGERTKANLLQVLQQPDRWLTPIVINLRLRAANTPELTDATLNVSQTGFGLKLQLDLLVTADIDAHNVEREMLRAVLVESMYRSQRGVPAGIPYVQPPDWLIDGLLLAAPDRENDRPVALLQTLSKSSRMLALRDFLRQRPELLDSPSRQIYRACSFALVELLLDSPDGRTRLAQFIGDLPRGDNDVMTDLKAHFPFLGGSDEKTEQSWTLGVGRISTSARYEALTINETERQLEQLLHVRISEGGAEKDYRLDEFAKFMKSPARGPVLTGLSEELLLLATHANPVYHPIVQEYQNIAMQLARGKTHKVAERLRRARSFRDGVAERMRDIDDYLNWFEATQLGSESGAFSDYLRAARRPEGADARRRDAITVYLDSLEAHFQSNR